jgi:hypothetical protein
MIKLELFNAILWAATLNAVTVLLTVITLKARAANPKLSPAKAGPSQEQN